MTAFAAEMTELQSLRQRDHVTWGILGGMGPLASSDLVRRIYLGACDGRCEQLMPKLVLHSDCSTPDRTRSVLDDTPDVLVSHLVGSCDALERAGVDAIVIACMTAHWVLPTLQQRVGLPIVSLVELIRRAPGLRTQPHLVIATKGSYKANLFSDLPATALLPDAPTQDQLHDAIYKLKSTGQYGDLVAAVLKGLETRQCNAVLAGCTEVSLIEHELPPSVEILDPMDLVATVIWDLSNRRRIRAA